MLAYWFLPSFEADEPVYFNAQIRPIINSKCISCHGGVKQSGGFSLLFPEEALRPNESGKPAIVPGKPEESELIRRVKHHDPEHRMPYEKEPLSEQEIDLLTRWIEQGAKWEEHWAHKKLGPVAVPELSSDWIKSDIDRFVLQKLEENRLQPSPQADKATLLRRASLDLTGLPPTEKELQDFLRDQSPRAFEKVVDRLLASPRFGERWAGVWMDLARYADSKGYEEDFYRNIWQYRDWLIKAFNDDKPYDQFILEQLAGDLLPEPTDDQLIATSFHRNSLNNDEGGSDNEEFRVAAVLDRVNTTWNVLQATTMECVQCHSHPYDPIRHEDYYKSYAFFNNTADADLWVDYPNLLTFTKEEDQQRLESIKAWVATHAPAGKQKQQVRNYLDLIRLTEPKIHGHTFDKVKKGGYIIARYIAVEDGGSARAKDIALQQEDHMLIRYKSESNTGKVEVHLDSPTGELLATWQVKKNSDGKNPEIISIPVKPVSGTHHLYFTFSDPEAHDYVCRLEWVVFYKGLPGEKQPGYQQVTTAFHSLLNSTEVIATPVMVELKEGYQRKTRVFDRGNWLVHGKTVDPGVPEAWNDWPRELPRNRLGLARWFASKDNPLTSRVMVNRLWARLFGTGIVETEEDFGSQGFAPTHAGLLDWLALQFMGPNNWSIKKQLRQMVLSATYQQASRVSPELLEKDPRNYLLARGPRFRLAAEQVRDQALAVSGLLSSKMYGKSVMPPQPEGVWRSGWKTSEGEDKYRRALYTYVRRTSPYPLMSNFDGPSREFCLVRRINTNTPLQALNTLNDPAFVEAAQALARRMQQAGTVPEQIRKGYKLAMLRDIGADKLRDLQKLHQQAQQHFIKDPKAAEALTGEQDSSLAALTVVSNAIMNLDEFLTKS